MPGATDKVTQREGLCEQCGREYAIPWFTANEVWNAAKAKGFLCIDCFIRKAEASGVECTGWKIVPENWKGATRLGEAIELLRCAAINCFNTKKIGIGFVDAVNFQITEAIKPLEAERDGGLSRAGSE